MDLPFLTHKNPLKLLSLSKLYYKYINMGWLEKVGGQGGIYYIINISTFTDNENILIYQRSSIMLYRCSNYYLDSLI